MNLHYSHTQGHSEGLKKGMNTRQEWCLYLIWNLITITVSQGQCGTQPRDFKTHFICGSLRSVIWNLIDDAVICRVGAIKDSQTSHNCYHARIPVLNCDWKSLAEYFIDATGFMCSCKKKSFKKDWSLLCFSFLFLFLLWRIQANTLLDSLFRQGGGGDGNCCMPWNKEEFKRFHLKLFIWSNCNETLIQPVVYNTFINQLSSGFRLGVWVILLRFAICSQRTGFAQRGG